MGAMQHYLWAGGHLLLLLCSLRYILAYIFFKSQFYVWWYRISFVGAAISYTIVCYKAFGVSNLGLVNMALVHRAFADENFQYFLLALFWWYSKPIPIALFPYMVFSMFHALTFVRTTVLPKLYPPPPPAPGASPSAPPQSTLGRSIQAWVKKRYDTAMRLTAFAEVLILFRVVLGALTLQNSLLSPIVYAHFMRQRYYHSPFTRDALVKVSSIIDGYMAHPSLSPIFGEIWLRFKDVLRTWAGNAIVPTQPGSTGARRSGTPRG